MLLNKYSAFYLLVLVSIGVLHYSLFPVHLEFDVASILAEGCISLVVLFILLNLSQLNLTRRTLNLLRIAFLLLLISLSVDVLDEVYQQPDFVVSLFEDLFQVIGFVVLLFGIRLWIRSNNQQKEKLKLLATTDSMTGALSRRAFSEAANLEFHKMKRGGMPFAVLLLDLDNFKSINDTYGHNAGDAILKGFVDEISHSIRQSDVFARWGGEEFILLATNIDDAGLNTFAEKLREVTEGMAVRHQGQLIRVTTSLGGDFSRLEDDGWEDTINRADDLLYKAKAKGRNRVELPLQ
ncbi:GGDEF domain-containing protein [Aliagarivorans taiwanensis]|uniref:GGDEF domain-containing protein n=1 Tax=Aliagarivorans taiwanensis TaxID=561966 RepID=UPI0003FB518C|nr:GGDEF domain-containing protein [Aliagarivorans taiwanensis]